MPKPKPEKNIYNLPRGSDIRRELQAVFARQRREVAKYLRDPLSRKDRGDSDWFPSALPTMGGTLAMSERFVPMISAYWDRAGQAFRSRVGLDPDAWDVTTPGLQERIQELTLQFCESTNATTTLELDEALRRTREELTSGVLTSGESIPMLTRRVNEVFDRAEKWRARRIAQSEASRAVHAAQERAAIDSGVVSGWEWLLSSDACERCLRVDREAKRVKIGTPFEIAGDGSKPYAISKFPPLHPHCNCTCLEVLTPEFGGPADVAWAEPVRPETQPEITG